MCTLHHLSIMPHALTIELFNTPSLGDADNLMCGSEREASQSRYFPRMCTRLEQLMNMLIFASLLVVSQASRCGRHLMAIV